MRIVATIEARMNSSRLPGKVLLKAKDKSMLEILVERLKQVKSIDDIIVATTINPKDNEIAYLCENIGLKFYRGSEIDVMGRVIGAAKSVKGDLIVEITADCPLIDPNIIEQIINIYNANSVDYVGNAKVRSYPDGMDAQVFSLKTLESSYRMTSNKDDREHVTLHIRNNPKIFSQINVVASPDIYYPELGLTLDEWDDYLLIKKIIENFYDENKFLKYSDIIKFLNNNPYLYFLNKHVKRKLIH